MRRVVDGVAHVSIRAEGEADLPAGLRGRQVLEGTARIRVLDAAYLGSHTQELIDLEGDKLDARVGRRIDVDCVPPASKAG